MESSHLVIFSTSGKFITKFNALRCISLSETLFWKGSRGRIATTLTHMPFLYVQTCPALSDLRITENGCQTNFCKYKRPL